MYRIKQLETDVNLAAFSQWLEQQGVGHRITAEGNHQVLWLENPDQAEPVLEALRQFLASPQSHSRPDRKPGSPFHPSGRWQASPGHAPLVMAMIGVAIMVAFATDLGRSILSAALMVVDPRVYPWDTMAERLTALTSTLAGGEVWRLVSPDFLHFSWPHLIFNSVMLWFLGSHVEWIDGRGRLLVLFVVGSLLSNGLQYFTTGPLFGGLSGVVYALVSYCWLSQRCQPRFQFPSALAVLAVAWVLFGFTPLPELLGLGRMANAAHLGGLLAGLLLGLVLPARQPRH